MSTVDALCSVLLFLLFSIIASYVAALCIGSDVDWCMIYIWWIRGG